MISGAQIRMARGYLKWSAKRLADEAKIAESTIKRMEAEDGFPSAQGGKIEAVYKVLIGQGIEFISENGGGAGVRSAKQRDQLTDEQRALEDEWSTQFDDDKKLQAEFPSKDVYMAFMRSDRTK